MIEEVEKLVNYLNNTVRSKKRKHTYETIFNEMYDETLNRFVNFDDEMQKLKGKKLEQVLKQFKKGLERSIDIINDNDDLTREERLKLVAKIAVGVYASNKILDEIKINPKITFEDVISYDYDANDEDYSGSSNNDTSSESDNDSLSNTKKNNIDRYERNSKRMRQSSIDRDNRKMDKRDSFDFINTIFKDGIQDDKDETLTYYAGLPGKERDNALKTIKDIKSIHDKTKPMSFRIMELPIELNQKNHILRQYTSLISSHHPDEKLKNWFESLMTIPFGVYKGVNIRSIKTKEVKSFLDNLQAKMDNAVYGHDEAKRQIIQMMGQEIRNPNSKGNCLGVWGPAGIGKTSLIKEGIADAMGKPFIFISLGGAKDSSFLEGHSFTYEGSIYGRIINGLITSKCMDPIIYFDELDKISKSHKGDEITNILIHLTDPAQNSHFRDKYFHGIDIDLSRTTMIFSFNDPDNIDPILLDRITTVETKYLMISQKVHIIKNYLMPTIIKDLNLKKNDIRINEDTIKFIVETYTREGGVRKLKSHLYSICRELNLANLVKSKINNKHINFPVEITKDIVRTLFKNKYEVQPEKIHDEDKLGFVNGLYASSNGTGGTLPIQCIWMPSTAPLTLKTTGSLEKVIKESMEVACSLAWTYIDQEKKDEFMKEWKERPMGFHIHCPDGSTSKDGPSAGGAITLAIYSLLTNRKIRHDIAMTGEINFEGKITAIGGLEEKLEGAKKAGVKLALVPEENEKCLNKIMERNSKLIDDTFEVIKIKSFDEIIKYSLI